jgi:hypothetical protein
MKTDLAVFEDYHIRRVYDEATETWFFSVVDVIQLATKQPNHQIARKYWNQLKLRLSRQEIDVIKNIRQLKMEAANGKKFLTDVVDAETLPRIISFVPSPNKREILEQLGIEVVKNRREFDFDEDIISNLFSGYTVERQKFVLDGKYRIDWYIPELNLAIEFNEDHHKHQGREDAERKHLIEKELDCKLVSYKDYLRPLIGKKQK